MGNDSASGSILEYFESTEAESLKWTGRGAEDGGDLIGMESEKSKNSCLQVARKFHEPTPSAGGNACSEKEGGGRRQMVRIKSFYFTLKTGGSSGRTLSKVVAQQDVHFRKIARTTEEKVDCRAWRR